jgi:hypothetical protein
VQDIGGHGSLIQVHAVQQLDDHRDLIRLGAGLGLSCYSTGLAGQGGQQVNLAAVRVLRAAYGLAVHPDRDQRRGGHPRRDRRGG